MTVPVGHIRHMGRGALSLGIMSFLYRDNKVYKFCEAIFIGISAGIGLSVISGRRFSPVSAIRCSRRAGSFFGGTPDLGGLSWCSAGVRSHDALRLIPSVGWLSRWPLQFVVGTRPGCVSSPSAIQRHDAVAEFGGAGGAL